MSERSDTFVGTVVLIGLAGFAFYWFSDSTPSSSSAASRYSGMSAGKTFILPDNSRPYGCKAWDAVEAIEGEAGRMGEASAGRMALRYIASGDCIKVRSGDKVLISANRVTSFQFRLPGSDQDYWTPKTF